MLTLHSEHLIVFGIETASSHENFEKMAQESPKMADLWIKLYENKLASNDSLFMKAWGHEQAYEQYAGLYPEFGRVTNVSFAKYIDKSDDGATPKIFTFSVGGTNETEILRHANVILSKCMWVGGNNIRNFTIPFFSRRSFIQGIEISDSIDVMNKKPWEMNIHDTSLLWNFGSFGSVISSLDMISTSLAVGQIDSECSGGDMTKIFWGDKNHELIARHADHNSSIIMKILIKLSNIGIDTDEILICRKEPIFKMLGNREKTA